MKINSQLILRQVGDEYIVLACGELSTTFNKIITLNEFSAFLWKIMEEDVDLETLIQRSMEECDVEREVVEADIKEFVAKLEEAGLLE